MAYPKRSNIKDTAIFVWDDDAKKWTAWDGIVALQAGTITVDPVTPYSVVVDEANETTVYIGEAAPGTVTSAASWRIKRINSGTITAEILYADGDDSFNQIWDNRANISYS
jgi:hypothetical protein